MHLIDDRIIYRELGQALNQLQCPDGPVRSSLETFLQSSLQADTEQEKSQIKALKAITKHFSLACEDAPAYAQTVAGVLAEATKRQPAWRVLFGLSNPQSDVTHDSVLHVALQINRFAHNGSEDILKDCLRLIANCCADNNINRKFCLDHNLLKDLLNLAKDHIEPDILIPTLYNICVDFEDPAEELDEARVNETLEHTADPAVNEAPSASIAAIALSQASSNTAATYEILLSLVSHCSGDRKAYLAELVELACSSTSQGIVPIATTETFAAATDATPSNSVPDALVKAQALADQSSECLQHIIRAETFLLMNEEYCKALLVSGGDNLWRLVMLTASHSNAHELDHDEYIEEIAESRQQFLKLFYQLTSMPDFMTSSQAHEALIDKSLSTLSSSESHPDERSQRHLRVCSLIILAQLAASESIREQLLSNVSLVQILSSILSSYIENEVLYPCVTLVTRLCRTDQTELALVQPKILAPLSRLLSGKGRGLAIPFEVVNAYRMMIRNRPFSLHCFTEPTSPDNVSAVSAVIELFNKTIEASTKLEVGHFFMEVLRTMFANMKVLDDVSQEMISPDQAVFRTFLDQYAHAIANIFAFVCCQAEPKEQRIHGWFAMGMLSVWRPGRMAIIHALEDDTFKNGLSEVSQLDEGPGAQNAKLMLSKLQQASEADVSEPIVSTLTSAAQALGMQFRFAS